MLTEREQQAIQAVNAALDADDQGRSWSDMGEQEVPVLLSALQRLSQLPDPTELQEALRVATAEVDARRIEAGALHLVKLAYTERSRRVILAASAPTLSYEEAEAMFRAGWTPEKLDAIGAEVHSLVDAVTPPLPGTAPTLTGAQLLLDWNVSHGLYLNANDFFGPGAATVLIAADDYEWLIPYVGQYGMDGINAALCYITRRRPWEALMLGVTFQTAYAALEALAPEVHSNRAQ